MKYWIGKQFTEEMLRNPSGWWWKRRVSNLKSWHLFYRTNGTKLRYRWWSELKSLIQSFK